MTLVRVPARVTFRFNTAAGAAANNALLEEGEPGYETDTGKLKVGDGATFYNALPYFTTITTWGDIAGTLSDQTDLQTALDAAGGPGGSTTQVQYNLAGVLAGSSGFVFNASGNVGIGPTAPAVRLHISGTTDATQSIVADGSGNISSFKLYYSGSQVAFFQNYQNTELDLGTTLNIPFLFYTNNTERIRIKGNGLVGIGTSSPDYLLDVQGSFGFTPSLGVSPANNGDVVFELTSNTVFTVKARGSDGTVRTATLTLA